jgi:hypothetical protein
MWKSQFILVFTVTKKIMQMDQKSQIILNDDNTEAIATTKIIAMVALS